MSLLRPVGFEISYKNHLVLTWFWIPIPVLEQCPTRGFFRLPWTSNRTYLGAQEELVGQTVIVV